jgi:hypothetical protein
MAEVPECRRRPELGRSGAFRPQLQSLLALFTKIWFYGGTSTKRGKLLGALLTLERLEKIRIKGFKSIKDLTVEIRSINVLIGDNGSGKSNFIGAFTLLQQITEGRLSAYVKTNGGGRPAAALWCKGDKRNKYSRVLQ